MRWDNLMKPEVRSEVLLLSGAALIFSFLTLFLLGFALTVINTP